MKKILLEIVFDLLSALWYMVALAFIFGIPATLTPLWTLAKFGALGLGFLMIRGWYKAWLFCVAKGYISRH